MDEFVNSEHLEVQSEQEEEQDEEYQNIFVDQTTSREGYDIEGPSKKKTRGTTECEQVHSRSVEDRKHVSFNVHWQPIGPNKATVKELSLFLGTLARNSFVCPLIYKKWKAVPEEKKTTMWKYVNLKYILPPQAKKWVLNNINNSWRCYKSMVKSKHFTMYQTDEERWKHRPKKIPDDHFRILLKYWKKKKVKKISESNADNRSKLEYMNRSGTTSYAVVRHDMKEKYHKEPTRVELFIETHKKKKGKRSDARMDDIVSELEELSKDPYQDPEDVFVKAFGKEKPGRVRTYGQGVTQSYLKKQIEIEAIDKAHKEEVESIKEDMKKKMDAHTNHVARAVHVILMNLKERNPSLIIDANVFSPLLSEVHYDNDSTVADYMNSYKVTGHNGSSGNTCYEDSEEDNCGGDDAQDNTRAKPANLKPFRFKTDGNEKPGKHQDECNDEMLGNNRIESQRIILSDLTNGRRINMNTPRGLKAPKSAKITSPRNNTRHMRTPSRKMKS